MLFDATSLTFFDDSGNSMDSYDVSGDKYHITVTSKKDASYSFPIVINELASTYLEYTVAFGFATGFDDQPAPASVYTAMNDDTSTVIVAFSCRDSVNKTLCNFDVVKPPKAGELQYQSELIKSIDAIDAVDAIDVNADPNNTHSVCNFETGKCDVCYPGSSGSGCVTSDSCAKDCKKQKPAKYLYECNWDKYQCLN